MICIIEYLKNICGCELGVGIMIPSKVVCYLAISNAFIQ